MNLCTYQTVKRPIVFLQGFMLCIVTTILIWDLDVIDANEKTGY